jgi:sugar phosphate isomerase/epimerase
MRRRTFLEATVAGFSARFASAGGDVSTIPVRLGFDTYSIRAFHWKAIQLLDYAAGLKLDTIQMSSLDDYESLEPEYLARVKDHAAKVGIAIDGGMGCICPLSASWSAKNGDPQENILRGLRVAKQVGATSMRCFMGSGADRRGQTPLAALMENTAALFRSVRSQALDLGVRIALENHAGDMQAHEVRAIIEEAGKDAVGSCLDTGNPMWVVEDPLLSLEILGPYVVTSHVRDSVVYENPRGASAQWTALGDGIIDFPKFMARYRELCPNAAMQLEIITGRPPQVLPYFEKDFWKAFPNAKAWEFARFVALAKNGRPFTGFMVVEDGTKEPRPEFTAALREQQRVDLERSLEYAKKSLGVGVRWKG